MATTDIYHITGGLKGRRAIACLGGDVDDYIQVDTLAAARTAANDTVGTIIAWINVPDITGTYTILGFGDKNVVEFLEFNVEAGLLTTRCTDATVAQFVTQEDAVGIKQHQWHHVAFVQNADGKGVQIYLDGVLRAATNDTATDVNEWFNNLDGIDSGRIGAANKAGNDSVTQEFCGGISDVKYYNTALTADQILTDCKNNVHLTTGCISWYDFDNDFIDSVSGYNGTNTGAGIVLSNNYCEFTSRLRNTTGAPVVADSLVCFADNMTGHAIVIQAA